MRSASRRPSSSVSRFASSRSFAWATFFASAIARSASVLRFAASASRASDHLLSSASAFATAFALSRASLRSLSTAASRPAKSFALRANSASRFSTNFSFFSSSACRSSTTASRPSSAFSCDRISVSFAVSSPTRPARFRTSSISASRWWIRPSARSKADSDFEAFVTRSSSRSCERSRAFDASSRASVRALSRSFAARSMAAICFPIASVSAFAFTRAFSASPFSPSSSLIRTSARPSSSSRSRNCLSRASTSDRFLPIAFSRATNSRPLSSRTAIWASSSLSWASAFDSRSAIFLSRSARAASRAVRSLFFPS